MYEALFLLEEGGTPEQVDQALRNFGMTMGVFEVEDMAGLDVAGRVRRELRQFSTPAAGDRWSPIRCARCDVSARKAERVGIPIAKTVNRRRIRRSGTGPFSGSGSGGFRSASPLTKRFSRALCGLINEGARVLEEGFALRASDIDVIYLKGYGFGAVAPRSMRIQLV